MMKLRWKITFGSVAAVVLACAVIAGVPSTRAAASGFFAGVFHISQDKYKPLALGQQIDALIQHLAKFPLAQDRLWLTPPVGNVLRDRETLVVIVPSFKRNGLTLAATAKEFQGLIDGDTSDPRAERRVAPEIPQMLDHRHHRVLHHILRVVVVVRHVPGQRVQPSLVPRHQLLERLVVAGNGCRD